MSIAFVIIISQAFALTTGLLYYNRRRDRYQNIAILLSILATVPICMSDTEAQSWRETGLMIACAVHLMVSAGLEASALAHVIGRACRIVWAVIRALRRSQVDA